MSCTIRKATPWDLPRIREIYEVARQFMRKNGNHSQWGKGDEPEALIEEDICQGNLYVLEEADIHAVFAFIIGEDPTYQEIEEGNWKSEEPYAAVHRVASDGTVQGVLGHVMDYCSAQVPHIRIDTHTDNKVMQHVLEKYGFVSCGIVHVPDGSPRIAYELLP
ncbi:Uncharacterised protein [uncultured Ruminococcus sp.]|nr:Uncharacterised protein [uncultured Ruminococcus sp.]